MVNLGEVFDLVNLNLFGVVDVKLNIIVDKNIILIIMEVLVYCLIKGKEFVIGVWIIVSVR